MDAFDITLANLAGEMPISSEYMTRDRALAVLRAISGEDYGYDVEAWHKRKAAIVSRIPDCDPSTARKRAGDLKRKRRLPNS